MAVIDISTEALTKFVYGLIGTSATDAEIEEACAGKTIVEVMDALTTEVQASPLAHGGYDAIIQRVDDKMPENEETVLVTIKAETEYCDGSTDKDTVFIAMFCEADPDEMFGRRHFTVWDRTNTELTTEVTAWMPLPKPYGGKA